MPGTEFGRSIALIPDVDLDGLQDLVIGAPAEGGGAIYVGLSSNRQVYRLVGISGTGRLGHEVLPLADLTQDGFPEFAISAPEFGGGGAVFIADLRNNSLLHAAYGAVGAGFGWDICLIGDVDGLGQPDLAIGAPDFSLGASLRVGAVFVLSLDNGALISPGSGAALHVGGSANARLGRTVAGVEDRDADGVSDLVASEHGRDQIAVLSSVSGARLRTLYGPAGSGFGAVMEVGDINDDGVSDVIGSPGSPAGMLWCTSIDGQRTFFSGQDGLGRSAFAATITKVPDLNGDGQAEFALAHAGNVQGDGLSGIEIIGFEPNSDGPIIQPLIRRPVFGETVEIRFPISVPDGSPYLVLVGTRVQLGQVDGFPVTNVALDHPDTLQLSQASGVGQSGGSALYVSPNTGAILNGTAQMSVRLPSGWQGSGSVYLQAFAFHNGSWRSSGPAEAICYGDRFTVDDPVLSGSGPSRIRFRDNVTGSIVDYQTLRSLGGDCVIIAPTWINVSYASDVIIDFSLNCALPVGLSGIGVAAVVTSPVTGPGGAIIASAAVSSLILSGANCNDWLRRNPANYIFGGMGNFSYNGEGFARIAVDVGRFGAKVTSTVHGGGLGTLPFSAPTYWGPNHYSGNHTWNCSSINSGSWMPHVRYLGGVVSFWLYNGCGTTSPVNTYNVATLHRTYRQLDDLPPPQHGSF